MVTLLKTKLYVPPLGPDLVSRCHLIERLNEGLQLGRKLTLLSAPAGYGKTTLLSEWIYNVGAVREPPLRVAWLSLDEQDDELARFFAGLVAALQTIDGSIGEPLLPLLETPQLPPVRALSVTLINDIVEMATPLVLVLDDYQVIVDRRVHEAIEYLVEGQPPQMHLVISTRQDPPLSLSRLRSRGQLTEIRQRDLQFGIEEAAAFMRKSAGLTLTAPQVAALRHRTEGWIAGLQLAALSMRDLDDDGIAQLIAGLSGRHHFILDFLTDEVLMGQSEPVRAFLLQTSILERMCGPLCDALLGGEAGGHETATSSSALWGQSMLEYLEQANLFLVPLDDERRWYRYHRLFTELLRAQLGAKHPDEVPSLHRRAAKWYGENSFVREAVRHALAASDFALAVDTIEQALRSSATWSRLDSAIFLEWWDALPDDLVRDRPELQLLASRSLYITGQGPLAERVLQETERWLLDHPQFPDAEWFLERIALDRMSYAAVRGEVRPVIAFTQRSLASLPEGEVHMRLRMASLLGLACLRAGEVTGAEQAFSQSIAAAKAAGLRFAATPLLANLADVQMAQGQLRQAMQTCEQAVAWGTVGEGPISAFGFVCLQMAKIQYEWDDLHTARRYIGDALRLLRQGRIALGLETAYAVLARIEQALGNHKEATGAIDQAVQIARGNDIGRLSVLVSAYRARIWMAGERIDLAAQWAEEYGQHGDTEYLREFEDLTLVRVILALDEPCAALSLLTPLLLSAEGAGRVGSTIEALALRALALSALGEMDEALYALERALTLARAEGYVRVFIDEGLPMARLLSEVARGGAAVEQVSRLLTAFDLELGHQESTVRLGRERRVSALTLGETWIEPLTERQMDVLALLAEGLTNPEIAERLFISLPTVKSHTRSIYGKLGVHSRREAVARAKALGILPV